MIDLEKLVYPKKSIRNDIDKWYKSSEYKEDQYIHKRHSVFTRLDRYACLDTTDDGGTRVVSLISTLPWFDETKYLEYAKDLINKKTFTSQFESIFNAIFIHFLIVNNMSAAYEFISFIYDNGINHDNGFKPFDYIVPYFTHTYEFNNNDDFIAKGAAMVLKYANKNKIAMRESVKRSVLNILSDYRDDFDENKNEYNQIFIKEVNTLLKKYPKYLRRKEYYKILRTHNNPFSSPELLLQAIESNETATEKIIDEINEFWNDTEKKMFIRCYGLHHERLIDALIAFFNKTGGSKSKAANKARLLDRLCNELKPDLDISNDIVPSLNDAVQTEYLYLII